MTCAVFAGCAVLLTEACFETSRCGSKLVSGGLTPGCGVKEGTMDLPLSRDGKGSKLKLGVVLQGCDTVQLIGLPTPGRLQG